MPTPKLQRPHSIDSEILVGGGIHRNTNNHKKAANSMSMGPRFNISMEAANNARRKAGLSTLDDLLPAFPGFGGQHRQRSDGIMIQPMSRRATLRQTQTQHSRANTHTQPSLGSSSMIVSEGNHFNIPSIIYEPPHTHAHTHRSHHYGGGGGAAGQTMHSIKQNTHRYENPDIFPLLQG